jgi:hypothetical protein
LCCRNAQKQDSCAFIFCRASYYYPKRLDGGLENQIINSCMQKGLYWTSLQASVAATRFVGQGKRAQAWSCVAVENRSPYRLSISTNLPFTPLNVITARKLHPNTRARRVKRSFPSVKSDLRDKDGMELVHKRHTIAALSVRQARARHKAAKKQSQHLMQPRRSRLDLLQLRAESRSSVPSGDSGR